MNKQESYVYIVLFAMIFLLFIPIFLGEITNNYYDSYDKPNQLSYKNNNDNDNICKFTPGNYISEDGNYIMTISDHIPWNVTGANNRHEHKVIIKVYYNYDKPVETYTRFIHPDAKSTFESSDYIYFIIIDNYIRVVDEDGLHYDIRVDGNYYLNNY